MPSSPVHTLQEKQKIYESAVYEVVINANLVYLCSFSVKILRSCGLLSLFATHSCNAISIFSTTHYVHYESVQQDTIKIHSQLAYIALEKRHAVNGQIVGLLPCLKLMSGFPVTEHSAKHKQAISHKLNAISAVCLLIIITFVLLTRCCGFTTGIDQNGEHSLLK